MAQGKFSITQEPQFDFRGTPMIPGTDVMQGSVFEDFFNQNYLNQDATTNNNTGINSMMNPELLQKLATGQTPAGEQGVFSLRDLVGDIASKGVAGFKDVASRSIASQALGGAGGMIFGPMGALAGGIAGLIKGGDLFNAPYIGAGAATVDEFGRMYSAEQLDKLNAAGGYYSDPARSSRRRDARIRNMIERRDAGLKIGLNNLAKLQEQQRREEAARQSAADAMRDSNRANRTGGYQSSMRDDTGFMEGPDTSKGESFSSVQGST